MQNGTYFNKFLGPKAQKEFDLCVSKLLDLSDFEAWYPLRGAIRDLDQARALKTCAVMAALFAVTTKLTREGVLAKAIDYETAWEYGAKRVNSAEVAVNELERKIREAEARRPDVLATTKFTDCKRALCDLVVCGLTALDQLYEIEGLATSPKILEVVNKAQLRQAIDEILHVSSRTDRARHWGELQDLLDGMEEIIRRPNPSDWKREPPEAFDRNGNRLRTDVKKLTASDLAALKRWVDLISPGMFDEIENASDQVKVLREAMETHPPFPPMLTYALGLAYLHQDKFKDLRAKLINLDRPKEI
jgi:hypothetical protein